MENKQTFREMFFAAKTMLSGKDPEKIARNAGVEFDGSYFTISSLGKPYRFSYPDYLCREQIQEWHFLTILHYLNLADGSPVTGNAIALADMPAGLVRGTKYDQTMAKTLSSFLDGKTEEQLKGVFQKLGGEILQGKADLNVRLPFLPRFPLSLNIWFADEEFPPSARLLVDQSAGHYLTIEDAVTVGDVVLEQIARAFEDEPTGYHGDPGRTESGSCSHGPSAEYHSC